MKSKTVKPVAIINNTTCTERGRMDSSTEKGTDDGARISARLCFGAAMMDIGEIKLLRASVVTYNRVVFQHPDDGTRMLALERKATVMKDGSISVQAQPYGGGVHILNPTPLKKINGEIHY